MIVHLKIQTAVGFLMCLCWLILQQSLFLRKNTHDWFYKYICNLLIFFHFGKPGVLVFYIKQESKGKIALFLFKEINAIIIRKKSILCASMSIYISTASKVFVGFKGWRFWSWNQNYVRCENALYCVTTVVHHIWIIKTEEMSSQANITYYEQVVWM